MKLKMDHNDPHGERLANWFIEKMGHGTPWSDELLQRPWEEVILAHGNTTVISDRTSAHYAAWHSPKRKDIDVGKRFKLKDCRIWMRLMFWSARDVGLFEYPKFKNWFIRIVGYFIGIYEYTAPPYAKESAKWSLNLDNIREYELQHEMLDL